MPDSALHIGTCSVDLRDDYIVLSAVNEKLQADENIRFVEFLAKSK